VNALTFENVLPDTIAYAAGGPTEDLSSATFGIIFLSITTALK
jgi:hypothetical protein